LNPVFGYWLTISSSALAHREAPFRSVQIRDQHLGPQNRNESPIW
jgi:hypothetical protein